MPTSALEAVRHYETLVHEARSLNDGFVRLHERTELAIREVQTQLEDALRALSVSYLPTMDATSLAEAERLTGFRGFSRRDPLKAMAREHKVLQQTVARIEADERYHRREFLVGPVGELTRARQEAQSLLEPWDVEWNRFQDLDGFQELLDVGYDTPAFSEKFWEPSYWKHWAAGDRICEALGMDDFGDDVLPAWQKVDAECARWQQELAKVDARIDEVHELVRQHDEALARIPRLPEIYLEHSQQVLAEHLAHADPSLLDTWLRQEDPEPRPVRLALRRVAGLSAKRDFLQELKTKGIHAQVEDLRKRLRKYNHKIVKYGRPKYVGRRLEDRDLDLKFQAKIEKLRARQDKVERLVDRLLAYDDYDRFDLDQDPELWWIEMTGKRPGSMTPTLRGWYERHPGAGPTHDPQVDAPVRAVAEAAADRELDALDYLS